MPWIIFAIAAPALYGISNFFDKFLIEKKIKDPILLTIFGGVIISLAGMIIFIVRGFVVLDLRPIFILLISGILAEIALVPYFKALSLEDASRISPLFQVIPVFVLILSYFLVGEVLAQKQLFGFFLILLGSFFISFEKRIGGILRVRKALRWVLLASILWAFSSVVFKFAIIDLNFWDALVYEFLGVAVGCLILFLFYSRRFIAQFKIMSAGAWAVLNINEVVYFLGRLCTFYAISLGPVSLVTVLNGFHPVFVLVFGFVLSVWFPHIVKEDIAKKTIVSKSVAMVLMILGLWFVSS
jgi:uncharacterized membrane protein